MKNYITMSRLTLTEGLGSQMTNFAGLYAVARVTGHRILLVNDVPAGKGLLLDVPFDGLPLDAVPAASLGKEEKIAYTFQIDTDTVVDSRVFEIDSNRNYDFINFFGSYRYWYPVREEIFRLFRFKREIAEPAGSLVDSVKSGGREVVALHVRRTDFLASPWHVNLSLDYYLSACAKFSGSRYVFLVFSDDIEWCKEAFSRRENFVYPDQGSQYVDLCAMTLCDHNIVANSTFSVWGALLNKSATKKVVCPNMYLKPEHGRNINYAWFPDSWIPVDDLLV
jgi:hypothetical protein